MTEINKESFETRRLKWYVWIAAALWTLVLGLINFYNLVTVRETIVDLARAQAHIVFQKEVFDGHWNSGNMQVNISSPKGFNVFGHITSLNLVDKKNAPDPWEREALKTFERGEKEVYSLVDNGKNTSLRLIEPLVIEERCLQCHSDKGYRLGDIRGGISIVMPMESFFQMEQRQRSFFMYVLSLVWIVGLGGIFLGGQKLIEGVYARERSLRALKESESHLFTVLNNIPDRINFKDADGRYILNNRAHLQFIGVAKPEDILGKTVFDVFPLELATRFSEDEQNVINSGKPLFEKEEIMTDRESGEKRWHLASKIPLVDSFGKVTSVISIDRDITKRKRAEERMNMLAQTVKGVSECVSITDMEDRYIFVNDAFLKTYGYSEEELLGNSIEIIRSPLNDPETTKMIRPGTLAGGWKGELINRRKGEIDFPISLSTTPLRDDDGEIIGMVGVASDITERKKGEAALQNERLLLRTLIDNIPDPIYSKDLECRKILANAADLRNMGAKTEAEVLGKNDFELFPKELAEKFFADDLSVIQTGSPVINREEYVIDEHGKKRWLISSKLPLRDKDNRIIGLVGIGRDITERKRADEELERERNLFRTVIDNIPDQIYYKDIKGGYVLNNLSHLHSLGVKRQQDLLGKTTFDFHPPDLAAQYFADEMEVISSAKPLVNKEEMCVHHDPEEQRWHLTNKYPLFDSQGTVIGLVGISHDITERKRAEKVTEVLYEISKAIYSTASVNELFQSIHNLLSSIIPAGNLFIALLTPNGKSLSFPYFNDEFDKDAEDWTDIDLFNSQSLTVEVLNTEQSLLLNTVQLQERYSTGKNKLFGTEPKCWLGIPLMLRENAIGVMVVQDYHNGYAYTTKDVALLEMAATQIAIAIERKQSEESLHKSEERFRSVTKSANDAIITSDSMGRIIDWNIGAEKIFGYREEEIIGRYLTKIMPQHYVEQHNAGIERAAHGGEQHIVGKTVELQGFHKNGNEFPIEISISQWETTSGKFFTAIIRNITERKKAEEEFKRIGEDLQETNSFLEEATARANQMAEQAEMASIAKSEFLANMSHEIRTPMNGVIGMTGLLLDTKLDDEQRRFAEIVRASGESLLILINDILDFSKIEAKKLDIETIDFDLTVLLDDFASALAIRASEKGLELLCAADPTVPTLLRGDPGRLRQILTNLVGNAIKFTQSGEVAVRVSLIEKKENEVMLRFSVRDTGIGIPKNKIGLLFGKFSQVDASTTRKYGGTGLGLAISKQLAELMGGEAGVQSEEGNGSEFWFTVRLEKQEVGKQEEIIPSADLRGIRVLIVDDNATNREILTIRLSSWGMRTSEVNGGPEALLVLNNGIDENDPFQIGLIDMQMPGMDGEELGRIIKADERLSGTRMIMLTSMGSRGDTKRIKKIGFAAYATKPVRYQELKMVLCTVLKENDGTESTTQPVIPQNVVRTTADMFADRKVRILLAEDNITNQQVALGILKKLGLRADAVANGAEAVKVLKTTPYDLVLMDVQMPEMDGYEATRQIRNRSSAILNHHIPIIAMTAHAMQGDRELCLEAGMNDYVTKPVSPKALSEALDKWLPKETKELIEQPFVTSERPANIPVQEPELPVFDWSGMMSRMMDDEEFTKEMIAVFLKDTPQEITLLKEYLEVGDVSGVERQAHSVKGAAASAGGERLRAVAFEMEKAGKAKDMEIAKVLLNELEMQFDVLKEAMETKLFTSIKEEQNDETEC